MPIDLSQIIVDALNAQTKRWFEMYRAVRKLYSDLTPDELKIWNELQESHAEHLKGAAQAQREIAQLKHDPDEYFSRLHASIERDTELIRRLNDGLFELVKNHDKAVQDWKRKNPPYEKPKRIKKRPKP